MKAVVNDALRRGLSGDKKAQPYEPKTRHSALQPGIDPGRLNQLADELADEDLIEGWANARS